MSFMGYKAVEDLLKGMNKEEFERKYGGYKAETKDEKGNEKEGFLFK